MALRALCAFWAQCHETRFCASGKEAIGLCALQVLWEARALRGCARAAPEASAGPLSALWMMATLAAPWGLLQGLPRGLCRAPRSAVQETLKKGPGGPF